MVNAAEKGILTQERWENVWTLEASLLPYTHAKRQRRGNLILKMHGRSTLRRDLAFLSAEPVVKATMVNAAEKGILTQERWENVWTLEASLLLYTHAKRQRRGNFILKMPGRSPSIQKRQVKDEGKVISVKMYRRNSNLVSCMTSTNGVFDLYNRELFILPVYTCIYRVWV